MGAGRPAKKPTRWLAPAAPVFAGTPAPTGPSLGWGLRGTCGSGFTREEANAVAGTGCAGVRGHARSHRVITGLGAAGYLWERVHPRRSQRGGWHRLRRCSRARSHRLITRLGCCGVPVGAGSPAKKPARWLAPAAPVFAGMPAPTGSSQGLGAGEYLWERACPRRSSLGTEGQSCTNRSRRKFTKPCTGRATCRCCGYTADSCSAGGRHSSSTVTSRPSASAWPTMKVGR